MWKIYSFLSVSWQGENSNRTDHKEKKSCKFWCTVIRVSFLRRHHCDFFLFLGFLCKRVGIVENERRGEWGEEGRGENGETGGERKEHPVLSLRAVKLTKGRRRLNPSNEWSVITDLFVSVWNIFYVQLKLFCFKDCIGKEKKMKFWSSYLEGWKRIEVLKSLLLKFIFDEDRIFFPYFNS